MARVASISTDYLLFLIGLGLLCFTRQSLRRGKNRTLKSEKQSTSADKDDFDPNERRVKGGQAIMKEVEFTERVSFGFLFRPGNIPMIGAAFLARFTPVFSSVFSEKQFMLFNRRG
jgi:hypothetical protein